MESLHEKEREYHRMRKYDEAFELFKNEPYSTFSRLPRSAKFCKDLAVHLSVETGFAGDWRNLAEALGYGQKDIQVRL